MAIETSHSSPTPRSRARARHITVAATLFLSLATSALAREEFRDRSVIGKWKLVSVLDLASIASLGEAEAKTLLGKTLTISETAVQVDEELCSPPEFWAERVIPEPHMQEKLHVGFRYYPLRPEFRWRAQFLVHLHGGFADR